MTTVLHVPPVDRSPPVGQQITDHYKREIREGRLAPGDELPANRKMAKEWKVSTATALRVAQILTREGWIETRPGRPPVVIGVPAE
jgi:DNA-binding transcriptional regulator YhcF (GntR family)